jgi:glucokinase
VTPALTPEAVGVLEIGGSHVTAALVRGDQIDVCERRSVDPAAAADDLVAAFAAAIAGAPAPAGTPWAVAIPGPFDYAAGIGRYRDVGKFDSLNGVDVARRLRAALAPVPPRIRFLNDAEAFAIGEWHSGAGRRAARCVGITLGSGVGSAFLDHGVRVTTGGAVPPDGELHLTRLAGADLEDVVSSRAILARYRGRAGTDPRLDVRDIFDRARAGDAWGAEVLHTAFAQLGHALSPWLRAFAAQVVVVGGAMAQGWDIVHPALSAGLTVEVPLRRSADPERAALIGAAAYLRTPA